MTIERYLNSSSIKNTYKGRPKTQRISEIHIIKYQAVSGIEIAEILLSNTTVASSTATTPNFPNTLPPSGTYHTTRTVVPTTVPLKKASNSGSHGTGGILFQAGTILYYRNQVLRVPGSAEYIIFHKYSTPVLQYYVQV